MFWRIHLFVVVALVQVFRVAASTDTIDYAALLSLKGTWENVPPNWVGNDPCGSIWDGIDCTDHRVTSIMLASFNISGELSPDINGLSELQHLDLSYNQGMAGSLPSSIGELKKLKSLIVVGCGFSGQIPPSIGALQNLVFLALNLNNFIGQIPPSIGNLSNLRWLDLADNKLTGSLPVSDGTTPGLDMLLNATHFHLGNNKLSGEIPSQLFSSNMKLVHLLLDHNDLTGSIPSSLGFVQKLLVVQLNRNSLIGHVPGNLNNLTSVQKLYLANNKLTGPLPNLTGMASLNYVDLSNNSFVATDVPEWLSSLQSLISLIMEHTHIQGQLPVSLFSLPQLQTIVMKNNQINGTLDIGSSYSAQLKLIDLQSNFIDAFASRAGYNKIQIILVGNLFCKEGVTIETHSYCTIAHKSNSSNSTPQGECKPSDKIYSPTGKCLYPYSVTLVFRATSFYDFGNESLYKSLEDMLMGTFKNMSQPVDSVSVSNPMRNINNYLVLNLLIFPSGNDQFNRTGISWIGFILSHQLFLPPPVFGPLYISGSIYPYFKGSDKSSSSTAVIIGAIVGGSVLILLLIIVGTYAFRQKRIARTASMKADPFASWPRSSASGRAPQLRGARCFSLEEIKKCTNSFSESNDIGTGGYGKVYRGRLTDGQMVAVKRGHERSMQGGLEFKTEIEILSRVHHRNLVGLVGFCFDHGEHILVYEYIPNGTLKDSLNGKTGINLDWKRRLRIALGAASGVQYLHDLANPPIIHRDIKSNNILLDERLNAKVADFGLSKLIGVSHETHVSTEVKGTKGYLDPEYYTTQELTVKSDVYSFGVLLLELLTSRSPITKGSKYIVREVEEAMDKSKDLYNLEPILDPVVASNMAPGSVERLVDVALRCVEDVGGCRPTMGEVVKEIEYIMEMAGLNPHADDSAASTYHAPPNTASPNPPYSNQSFFTDTSGSSNLSK